MITPSLSFQRKVINMALNTSRDKEVLMEVCVDSVESALAAKDVGAHRVELCSALSVGGLTPTVGLLKSVQRIAGTMPVFAMIRPRGGDFLYSDHEFDVMKEDITALISVGADGFVFGVLNCNGTLDVERNGELVQLAHPFPATLHRAFDMTSNLQESLAEGILCGFSRVLTSGGEQTVEKGAPVVKSLVDAAKGNITVMPGSGISEKNVSDVLTLTGCTEFHCSGKVSVPSEMTFRRDNVSMGGELLPSEYTRIVSSKNRLMCILKQAQSI
jgi:copper homeostasis protein